MEPRQDGAGFRVRPRCPAVHWQRQLRRALDYSGHGRPGTGPILAAASGVVRRWDVSRGSGVEKVSAMCPPFRRFYRQLKSAKVRTYFFRFQRKEFGKGNTVAYG